MKRVPQPDGLGRRLREVRTLRGMDQAGLGRLAGLHTGLVSRIELGRHPYAGQLQRLAAVLGVSVYYLLTGQPDDPNGAPDRPNGAASQGR